MRMQELARLAVGVAVAVALTPGTAHAQYLDPGAGSIIVQVVLALVIGTAAAVRLYWGKLSAMLSRRSRHPGE